MLVPLISVVIPTHNRVKLLKHAVDSVLAQTEQRFEIIIVDDASSDGTENFLLKLKSEDERVNVICNKSSLGGGGARNAGIFACKGKWVAFLDDDDTWVETKLAVQLACLNADSQAVACSGTYKLTYESGMSVYKKPPMKVELDKLLLTNNLGGASLCICLRSILLSIGGFDTKLRSGQDWDLWVRLLQQGNIVICKEILVLYNAHEGVRITNNMDSQYFGARLFYFKHRNLMTPFVRRYLLSYLCFIMSRQITRNLYYRSYFLKLASLNSPCKVSLSYIKSSMPRIFLGYLIQILRKN